MLNLLLIAAGGAAGSVARYSFTRYVAGTMPKFLFGGMPWGILAVNVLGSFLVGLCVHFLPRDENMRLLVITGFLGGFTTFSAFSIESMQLLKSNPFYGCLYIGLSVFLSIGAVFLGAKIHV